ncbi:protein BimD [Burkholderia oklahomensis]|uniref:protein BimD n=1 Tax=Burkholderia oklahomensis TaxID=342113 RepID=UPI00264F397F|nr:protein BimD [Burkholderia oklahomensis]MDN7675846.1 protein BimD [Burkholderia oklahomensis]
MKFPILIQVLPALALSVASLGGCNRDAEPMPVANADAGAPASRGWPAYMEEFNESIRSMSGEHETGVHINRGWGVFNTAKSVPSTDSASSSPAAPTDTSGTHRTPSLVHRPDAPADNSQMS